MDREYYMRLALELAREAALAGETPVGALVVDAGGSIVGRGRNRTEETDATAHAEMEAIRAASAALGSWRLEGCTLYVTMEPCPMCAGAVYSSRISAVVFGAPDPRAGALGGRTHLFMDTLDRSPKIYGGVLAEECRSVLSEFFRGKR